MAGFASKTPMILSMTARVARLLSIFETPVSKALGAGPFEGGHPAQRRSRAR